MGGTANNATYITKGTIIGVQHPKTATVLQSLVVKKEDR